MSASLAQQAAEVRREVGMRRRVYPRLVAGEKLTQAKADAQIERMEAAAATLERLRDAEAEAATPSLFP